MKLAEDRQVALAPEAVWAAILDTGVWLRCVPSLESLTGSVAAGYDAVVVQRVGPLRARFTGRIMLSEVIEGQSLRVDGAGQGGLAGAVRGRALVRLEPAPGGTRLAYDLEAEVGGRLAALAGPVIDAVARRLADQFFDRFLQAAAGTLPDPAPKTGWLRRLIG